MLTPARIEPLPYPKIQDSSDIIDGTLANILPETQQAANGTTTFTNQSAMDILNEFRSMRAQMDRLQATVNRLCESEITAPEIRTRHYTKTFGWDN